MVMSQPTAISRRSLLSTATGLLPAAVAAMPDAVKAASGGHTPVADVVVKMEGKPLKISSVIGSRATLVVNVASYCALTPQYNDLVDVYNKFHSKGLQILAFPCNQFGSQEPETEAVIRRDISKRFGAEFPIFDKQIDVNGPTAHQLYVALKSWEPELSGYGDRVNWNFEKFLLNGNGIPVRRYRPGVLPTDPRLFADVKALTTGDGTLPPRRKTASLNEY
ncbi:unnamed protein product [Phaeothamnion confervicola]